MYIFGASGHGKVIASILKLNHLKIDGFIDDTPKSSKILDVQVYPTEKVKLNFSDDVLIGIGNNKIRKKIASQLEVNFPSVIHPHTSIDDTVKIGEGSVVMAGAIVNAEVAIGSHCIINSASVVEHDCKIEDFVHISPGVALAGNVKIGEGTHVGIGSTIIQGVKVGKWVTIGAGTVVIKDIPDGVTVVGNPARIIKP